MADQPPETPEALARAVLYGDVDLEQSADRIRTRDAALIAQHTAELTRERDEARRAAEYLGGYEADLVAIRKALDAVDAPHDPEDGASLEPKRIRLMGEHTAELTARIRELEAEAVKGEQAAAERIVQLEGKVRWLEAAQREVGDRNAHLEAQLVASVQLEASARAEAREAALREAKAAVVALYRYDESQPDTDSAVEAIRKLLTSPPPPRVDAWIPVSEKLPDRNAWVLIAYRDGVSFGAREACGDTWYLESDGDRCDTAQDVTHWQPLPPPLSAEPANGGSDV